MTELRTLRIFVLALMLVLSGPAVTSATEPVLSPADETRLGDAIAMRSATQGTLIERRESARKLSARHVDVHPVTRRRMAALAAWPIAVAVDASPEVAEAFERLRALLADS